MIPIFSPHISNKAKKNVNTALNSNWISSQGKFVLDLESKIKEYHKMKYCLVTSSCTSALHLSLLSLGLKKGDEIICPSLSFIAPANMILLSNFKIVFVDIDINTLNIDINRIENRITKKTKAILFVNQFGHPADIDKLKTLKKKYNLKLIEDNAESLGGKYKNKLNGTHGDISTMSFFANKIVTTGEGGAILTNNLKYYKLCKEMRDHGMSLKKKYFHTRLGFNYRMTNLQAAIGCAQMGKINKIIKKKRLIAKYYKNYLGNNDKINLPKEEDYAKHVYWVYHITLKNSNKNFRNKIMFELSKKGVETRETFIPFDLQKKFIKEKKFKYKSCPVADKVSNQGFYLPSGYKLNKKDIKYISEILIDLLEHNGSKT